MEASLRVGCQPAVNEATSRCHFFWLPTVIRERVRQRVGVSRKNNNFLVVVLRETEQVGKEKNLPYLGRSYNGR